MSVAPLPRKAKGQRPHFFEDPAVDRLVAMVMGLAGEVAVLHDRLDTMERIADRKGMVLRSEIESFEADDETKKEREEWRAAFLDNVLRIVQQELEGEREGSSRTPYQEAIHLVENAV
ncbi:MAG TPA: hypothetical protein VED40_02715 [Azospirillaceae bacterium]|nr:hypothetical protein [Azospirillaceae bacterium]